MSSLSAFTHADDYEARLHDLRGAVHDAVLAGLCLTQLIDTGKRPTALS